MRQLQVRHVSGEIVFTQFTAKAWIEAPLLAHTGDRQPAIIVGRVKQARSGQRKNVVVDRAKHGVRVTALEIRAASTSDQQANTGKRHGLVVEYECDASIGMTRCCTYHQVPRTKLDLVSMAQIAVRAF